MAALESLYSLISGFAGNAIGRSDIYSKLADTFHLKDFVIALLYKAAKGRYPVPMLENNYEAMVCMTPCDFFRLSLYIAQNSGNFAEVSDHEAAERSKKVGFCVPLGLNSIHSNVRFCGGHVGYEKICGSKWTPPTSAFDTELHVIRPCKRRKDVRSDGLGRIFSVVRK
jgi:hypothetical protein